MSTSGIDVYFERIAPDTFVPQRWTEGAWRTTEQHVSPSNGLLVHCIERFLAERGDADELQVARVSIDILGVLTFDPMHVTVEVLRGGRTIELIEATISQHGRAALRARVWRLAPFDTSAVAGGLPDALPAPDTLEPWTTFRHDWPGDYIHSLDARVVREPVPGSGALWLRTPIALVAGEPVSELARFVGLVDTANGIAVREAPSEWLYPNVDLTIHLHRQPRGEWVGLDTTVAFDAAGIGLTSTVLHDVHGPVGRAAQALTIRPTPHGASTPRR